MGLCGMWASLQFKWIHMQVRLDLSWVDFVCSKEKYVSAVQYNRGVR